MGAPHHGWRAGSVSDVRAMSLSVASISTQLSSNSPRDLDAAFARFLRPDVANGDASADTVRGSGVATTQRRDIGTFVGIALGGPFAVSSYTQSDQEWSSVAMDNLGDVARREKLTGSYFVRLVRLSYLAPDITRAILDGRHPRDLSAAKLLEHSRLPLAWPEQRRLLGFT